MTYSSKAVANWFIEEAETHGEGLTPMKIQKLVYYSHGWNLALTAEPLLDEFIEAWPYGPVIPSLYHEFKEFGSQPITRLAQDFNDDMTSLVTPSVSPDDEHTKELLTKIWSVYSGFTAIKLSSMTHIKDAPWAKTRAANIGIRNAQIDNNMIKNYFMSQMIGV